MKGSAIGGIIRATSTTTGSSSAKFSSSGGQREAQVDFHSREFGDCVECVDLNTVGHVGSRKYSLLPAQHCRRCCVYWKHSNNGNFFCYLHSNYWRPCKYCMQWPQNPLDACSNWWNCRLSFRTWTGATYGWLTDNGAWASFPSITTDGAGSWSGWAYGAVPIAAANTWLEGRINCGGTNHSTSARVQVTLLNMSSTGGWLEESNGTSRAGRAVVVRTGSTIIGMYAVENNNVNEGYPSTPGYFRVAVPACTTCGYTIETWDLASPGTAVGTINTMGTNSCPDAITVASITSLNSCAVPTSITLKSISANTTPELMRC